MVRREDTERLEDLTLSPFAARSAKSRGRAREEEPDPLRTAFQRDRDRILHCKSFRRLSHKTQVFIGVQGDHYRTRLTHTLEVQQISRTIARALGLNEDLTEAIALGHDLGHTPFGHTGEGALQQVLRSYGASHPGHPEMSFHHNVQSLRVVDVIEKDGRGLNLTEEVRDGILHHTGKERAFTLEGQVVAIADRIAYVNHDIDDSIRAGIISRSDLPADACAIVGNTHSERITTMVNAMVSASDGKSEITMEQEVYDAMMDLRRFLFSNVYENSAAKDEEPKARRLVALLFEHYLGHMDEVPEEYRRISGGNDVTAVIDYIAGMTDRYASTCFERLFIPTNWRE